MHCNTCKCAQHDHCCRRAVKLHSFIHSFIHSKSISVKKKKHILNQKGGFLSLLAPALLPLLGKAVIGGIGGALKSL